MTGKRVGEGGAGAEVPDPDRSEPAAGGFVVAVPVPVPADPGWPDNPDTRPAGTPLASGSYDGTVRVWGPLGDIRVSATGSAGTRVPPQRQLKQPS